MLSPEGEIVDIDVELVVVIEQAWALGCATNWSCQDHGEAMAVDAWTTSHLKAYRDWHMGWAVIDFRTPVDMLSFLDAASRGGPRDSYYLRMVHSMAPHAWRVGATVRDLAIRADEAGLPPETARFAIGSGRVLLPRSDLSETADRLVRWQNGYKQERQRIDWDLIGWR